MGLRGLRIAGFAAGLAFLFHLSREAGRALNGEEAPGLLVAIAIVSMLFSIRAVVTEKTMGPVAGLTKKPNKKEIQPFAMRPDLYTGGKYSYWNALKSVSILPLYLPVVAILLVIYFFLTP